MTTDVSSPLHGVATFDQLLALPYFEFLSCLGEFSLHPGGLEATVSLLKAAGLSPQDRVLEIGCGTGQTTRALLAAGLDVSVVEPSERMLRAALRNCSLGATKRPKHYQCAAEDLSRVPQKSYDVVLYECVFGFISDPRRALRECARVMSGETSRICVIDLHYGVEPPHHVRTGLKEIFGREIAVLYDRDWHALFSNFRPRHWETTDVPMPAAPEPSQIRRSLSNAGLLDQLPGSGDDRFDRIAARWRSWNEIFLENKKYMRVHRAVWTLGAA